MPACWHGRLRATRWWSGRSGRTAISRRGSAAISSRSTTGSPPRAGCTRPATGSGAMTLLPPDSEARRGGDRRGDPGRGRGALAGRRGALRRCGRGSRRATLRERHWLLDQLAVEPVAQGRGIGGAMLRFAISTARRRRPAAVPGDGRGRKRPAVRAVRVPGHGRGRRTRGWAAHLVHAAGRIDLTSGRRTARGTAARLSPWTMPSAPTATSGTPGPGSTPPRSSTTSPRSVTAAGRSAWPSTSARRSARSPAGRCSTCSATSAWTRSPGHASAPTSRAPTSASRPSTAARALAADVGVPATFVLVEPVRPARRPRRAVRHRLHVPGRPGLAAGHRRLGACRGALRQARRHLLRDRHPPGRPGLRERGRRSPASCASPTRTGPTTTPLTFAVKGSYADPDAPTSPDLVEHGWDHSAGRDRDRPDRCRPADRVPARVRLLRVEARLPGRGRRRPLAPAGRCEGPAAALLLDPRHEADGRRLSEAGREHPRCRGAAPDARPSWRAHLAHDDTVVRPPSPQLHLPRHPARAAVRPRRRAGSAPPRPPASAWSR